MLKSHLMSLLFRFVEDVETGQSIVLHGGEVSRQLAETEFKHHQSTGEPLRSFDEDIKKAVD